MLTLERYHRESRGFETAVIVTVPLFVAYEIGLLAFTSGEVRNAAEVCLRQWLGLVGRTGKLVLTTLVLLGLVVALVRRGRRPVTRGVIPLLLAESAVYAIVLGPIVNALGRFARL